MIIKDMFERKIDREITGVIKVGDEKTFNIKQELEEYVVTKELQKHFSTFFSNYKKGINGNSDKAGVWISGFFGSGKSHFLKILSYLIENREVDGKKAIDYFIDDNKIDDEIVIANMKLASSVPTDVILFNIDSKSSSDSAQNNKEVILKIFNKVFNQHLGYYGANPHIANFEKILDEENLYDKFQQEFEKVSGKKWVDSRNKFTFITPKVCETLVNIGYQDMDSAKTLCASFNTEFNLDIETFAKEINEYIKKQGENHHVVFMVDEMGQYIGDKSDLMLNLQTITEDLGNFCNGNAWIMVTSQQDIDDITKTKGNDFSKIQGRFDTRLALSSANVDEVICKRILQKNEVATNFLTQRFEKNEKVIENLILFNDDVNKDLYKNVDDFVNIYPFVPYQFFILGKVLTSIRVHGSSGKHLGEGERSMVALFKESAVSIMLENENTLVPFYMFYEPIEKFLDHSHKGVIVNAYKNERLVPNEFAVNVLKVLFMIKYVKEIVPNVENITTLMVSKINEIRSDLQEKVEDALKQLCTQTLIQKNNDTYVFLTNEEQDINKEIDKTEIDSNAIDKKIMSIIFDSIYEDKNYSHKVNGKSYTFQLNQFLDNIPFKNNQHNVIGLNVITSDDDITTLSTKNGSVKEVYIKFINGDDYRSEIRTALQIDKFVRDENHNKRIVNFETIVDAKKRESRQRIEQATAFLKDCFNNATIISNGRTINNGKSGNTNTHINEGIVDLINNTYTKLKNIDTPMKTIDIKNLLDGNNTISERLDGKKANENAIKDILQFIVNNGYKQASTSLETILKQYSDIPNGFADDDILWCVASLFYDKHVDLFVSNEQITTENKKSSVIYDYLTKKEYITKILFKVKNKANVKEKKIVIEVLKELFNASYSNTDEDDKLFSKFKQLCNNTKDDLNQFKVKYVNANKSYPYPGVKTVDDGIILLKSIIAIEMTDEFFTTVSNKKDNLLDLAEDLVAVNEFFKGKQVELFDKAVKKIEIYEKSESLISDTTIKNIIVDMNVILTKNDPYSEIHKLNDLITNFNSLFFELVKEYREPILEEIENSKKYVLEQLDYINTKECEDKLLGNILSSYDELIKKCTTSNDLGQILILQKSISTMQDELVNLIRTTMINLLKKSNNKTKLHSAKTPTTTIVEPVTQIAKEVSFKSLSIADSWRIETQDDIERYIKKLKSELEKSLEGNVAINVKF